MKAIEKYLARHAEPEAAAAAGLEGVFGHALEIPAYGEGDALFEALASIPAGAGGEVLIVLVLNARADSPTFVHEANARVRERLDATAPSRESALSGNPAVSVRPLPRGTLVVIDRALPGRYLPEGQGVGLARKIGCDFILHLRASGQISSPWIHCTDADVRLPRDYFEQLSGQAEEPPPAAALYFFEHDVEPDEGLARAARLYEISLRYYVLGLAWAGSPYAYQSMGSCLAVRDVSYAAVRGFPRRNALEDFYALNKLAKVGTIARLAGTPLRLKGRVSDRVPVSTGKALGEMVADGPRARRRSLLYHPAVFAHLAAWLRVLGALARSGGKLEQAFGLIPRDNPFFRADLLEEALAKLGAFEAVREALAVTDDPVTLGRRLHAWFDAFRTLKLIHALRDTGLHSLHWSAALSEAPFTGLSASTEESEEDLGKALAREERTLAGRPAGLGALETDQT
ncbi:MAG: hypothetical protein ABR576_07930 [Thermoanaerobaculia bacterium]